MRFPIALVVLFAAGCASKQQTPTTGEPTAASTAGKKAIAKIDPKSGSELLGVAVFKEEAGQITLVIDLSKAPAGKHAAHLHEKGDCSAPDGTSAGAHWNPTTEAHGKWGHGAHHLGDIGNIEVGEDKAGRITLTTDKWSIGTGATNDIVGKAVIVHAVEDDFTTQPTGNAGGRIGCGVVTAN